MRFNIPYTTTESFDNVKALIENPEFVNDGNYVKKCKKWFEDYYPDYYAFMTTSCTRALELISLSLNFSKEDEVILSPFNYVGVGNAFANYGVKLVYVDIEPNTMNINANLIEASITKNTKAIIAMHYASIGCDMDKIRKICDKYNLILIEDNAQGIQTYYKNKPLGSFGDFSCISFDILKNISCNEGGVLMCQKKWLNDVDVAFNNGTNKSLFLKGLVEKYEWTNTGSKFSMSEYNAAVLLPLLEKSADIIKERKIIWNALFRKLSSIECLKEFIPQHLLNTDHNAHLAYLKFKNEAQRNYMQDFLNKNGVPCSFHYTALDDSEEGKKHTSNNYICPISLQESKCILRLPMHNSLDETNLNKIVETLQMAINNQA